jgi:RNase P subunit RPR2
MPRKKSAIEKYADDYVKMCVDNYICSVCHEPLVPGKFLRDEFVPELMICNECAEDDGDDGT